MIKIVNKRKYEGMVWKHDRVNEQIEELKVIFGLAKVSDKELDDFEVLNRAIRIVEKEYDLKMKYLTVRMTRSYMLPDEIVENVHICFDKDEYEIRGPYRAEMVSEIIEVRTRRKEKIEQFVQALEKFNYPLIKSSETLILIDY